MSTDLEIVDLTEIVGEHDICCDYNGDLVTYSVGEHDDPARWVMWSRDHGCGTKAKLACDRCKNVRLGNAIAGVECSKCGFVAMPARHFYSRVEAL